MPSTRSLCVSVCGLAALWVSAGSLAAREARVDPSLRVKIREAGSVVAAIELADPARSGERLETRCEKYASVQKRVLDQIDPASIKVRYRYRYSPVILAELSGAAVLDALERCADVKGVTPDAMGSGGLVESLELIGGRRVHERGITGAGRVVAVLDTGVDTDHPDLEGAVLIGHHFLGAGALAGPGAEDDHGHGSHVAGIIASRGLIAPPGVAPEVSLVAVKVLDQGNRGFISDWARGAEFAIGLHAGGALRIDAISMSLVSDAEYAEVCDGSSVAFAGALAVARELGIVLIACGGNRASTTRLTLPGCFSTTISVASAFDALPDAVSSFASRNEFLDLLAPGEPITSVGMGGGVRTMSGCSMATPHVAGLVALLREADADVSPEEVHDILVRTGVPVFDEPSGRMYPRIDAEAAIEVLLPLDCNMNGVRDPDEIASGASEDCNGNRLPDECDVASGSSPDTDGDGVPDECRGPVFHRGDANTDGVLDVSDAIFLVSFLFLGGDEPSCLESGDVNNDRVLDVSDGVGLVSFLFNNGPPPRPPGPVGEPCGADPDPPGSAGDFGCRVYDWCARGE